MRTDSDECQYWPCDEPADSGETRHESKFCSTYHMLKYDHIKADVEGDGIHD